MGDYENFSVVERRTFRLRSRIHSDTNDAEEPARSGRRLNSLVIFLFGVLCMTQATLNIVLRLYLTDDKGSVCENATVQRDDLQQKSVCDCNDSGLSFPALQTSHQTLSEQRDELQRHLQSIVYFAETHLNEHWRFFKGSFYLMHTEHMSWMNSRQYCVQRDADLIIINSKEEQEFAMTFDRRSWIGLTDRQQEGVWRWVDGSLLSTSFWHSGEPNNKGNEDCVELLFDKLLENWNDESCSSIRPFICEKKIY